MTKLHWEPATRMGQGYWSCSKCGYRLSATSLRAVEPDCPICEEQARWYDAIQVSEVIAALVGIFLGVAVAIAYGP
jgi:hypothetical protein